MDYLKLVSSKALKNRYELSFAEFESIEDNIVFINIDYVGRLGFNVTDLDDMFVIYGDYENLIKDFIINHTIFTNLISSNQLYIFAEEIYEVLSFRFKDISFAECYRVTKIVCDE